VAGCPDILLCDHRIESARRQAEVEAVDGLIRRLGRSQDQAAVASMRTFGPCSQKAGPGVLGNFVQNRGPPKHGVVGEKRAIDSADQTLGSDRVRLAVPSEWNVRNPCAIEVVFAMVATNGI